jgi:anti-sigma B factor antagonist
MSFTHIKQNEFVSISTDYPKLDSNNAQELKDLLHELNKKGTQSILMNLAQSKYCDSSGLGALLMAHRITKEVGGNLVLCCLQPNVLKMIQIAQLDRVFKIFDTENEACQGLSL